MTEIRFYRANEKPYGVFSNLYRCTVLLEGIEYPTAEHAYQAGKALKPEVRDWILAAPTPALCAMAAHGLYKWDVRPDWAKIKFKRMYDVLVAKFVQHDDLRKTLMDTGAARLVEAGTTDNAVNRLWGEVDGRGKNMLGVLLMQVRNELGGPLPCQCDGDGVLGGIDEDGEHDVGVACSGCNNCKPPEQAPKKRRGGNAS